MEPKKIDERIIKRYGITSCRMTRLRQNRKGCAKLQCFRFGYFFIILATDGKHLFFNRERNICDIRVQPLRFNGYSISYAHRVPRVEIATKRYRRVRRSLLRQALKLSKESLKNEFRSLRYLSYPGVLRQKLRILRAVNRKRKIAGLPLILSKGFDIPKRKRLTFLKSKRTMKESKNI